MVKNLHFFFLFGEAPLICETLSSSFILIFSCPQENSETFSVSTSESGNIDLDRLRDPKKKVCQFVRI